MKIVVIGGSGLIGSRVVTLLGEAGHQVLAASPRTGVDTITGEGLTDALTDADVVVDVANAPSWEPQAVLDFFRTSARNLGKAEVAAGVRHHVALSIVGCDRMPENGYFAAKVAQEQAIEAAGVPYTIVRATQFMEFIGGIADSGTEGGTVRIGDGLFQPIAAEDVAVLLAQIALAGPLNGTVEIAGPDRAPFAEIVARYLKSVGDARAVVTDRDARYYGGRVEETSLVPLGPARLGRIGLDQWLARS
ncbi:NmrA family transcriptional regulator [Burkholderia ubonensis]|uniref:SDR family oxidoreductase n=1 Tax=Burkholderia ubonensis TaxID=101571 RepID=UPI0007604F9B|nr:SDR family oxidoreductase [Burkholderia ubonensis]KVZ47667.1 NmrA family transcriptional regulator [Burkholderia ubonensis]